MRGHMKWAATFSSPSWLVHKSCTSSSLIASRTSLPRAPNVSHDAFVPLPRARLSAVFPLPCPHPHFASECTSPALAQPQAPLSVALPPSSQLPFGCP